MALCRSRPHLGEQLELLTHANNVVDYWLSQLNQLLSRALPDFHSQLVRRLYIVEVEVNVVSDALDLLFELLKFLDSIECQLSGVEELLASNKHLNRILIVAFVVLLGDLWELHTLVEHLHELRQRLKASFVDCANFAHFCQMAFSLLRLLKQVNYFFFSVGVFWFRSNKLSLV